MEEEGEAQPSPHIVWPCHSLQGALTLSKPQSRLLPAHNVAVLFEWGVREIPVTYNFPLQSVHTVLWCLAHSQAGVRNTSPVLGSMSPCPPIDHSRWGGDTAQWRSCGGWCWSGAEGLVLCLAAGGRVPGPTQFLLIFWHLVRNQSWLQHRSWFHGFLNLYMFGVILSASLEAMGDSKDSPHKPFVSGKPSPH